MHVASIRLVGIRCFADSGDISLSSRCNIFVGQNNTGKSTLLRAVLSLQYFPFSGDVRPGVTASYNEAIVAEIPQNAPIRVNPGGFSGGTLRVYQLHRGGNPQWGPGLPTQRLDGNGLFENTRPNHGIVPFLTRRKTAGFDQNVNLAMQSAVEGTYRNLYSRIDLLATAGHPRHEEFQGAIREIVGLPITTKAAANGKEAGFYFDVDHFVSLERMGDGVTEMVALVVELCLERGKIFVLEEPETNLHPKGLKALLGMINKSAEHNQFVIATHSNIVVRDLGSDEATKVFHVSRNGQSLQSPSVVEELPRTPEAHQALLRELGYEFSDLGLYEGWLFLEESSAETIVRDILLPMFAPELRGRLRTYAAGGAGNIEPSVSEFQRLATFVHLQPIYRDRLWIRADGDAAGKEAIEKIRGKFEYLDEDSCSTLSEPGFELYYPEAFSERAREVLALADKSARRAAKQALLMDVANWSRSNWEAAKEAWQTSAKEIVGLLQRIREVIDPV